jgi:hypothetical protein
MKDKTEGEQGNDSRNETTSRCEASAAIEEDEKPRSDDESQRGETAQAGGTATSLDHDRAAKPDEKLTRRWGKWRPIPDNTQTRRMGGGSKGRKSSHGGSEIGDSRADRGRQHPQLDDKVNLRGAESGRRQGLTIQKDGYERNETDKDYGAGDSRSNGAQGAFDEGKLTPPPGTHRFKGRPSTTTDGRSLTDRGLATVPSSFALALPNLERDQQDPRSLVGAWRIVEGAFYRLTPTTRRSGPERGSFGGESDDGEGDGAGAGFRATVEGDPHPQAITLADGTLVEEMELVEGKVEKSRRRRIVRLCALVLMAVGIVAVAVAVAVGVSMTSRRSPDPNPPTSSAAPNPPTTSPTLAPQPITEAMVEAFRNDSRLSNATLSAMLVDGTPQFKAFQWLTSTDHPAIPDDSNPVHRMVQQFALAVLYYATNATNATNGSDSTGGWKTRWGG